MERKSIFILTIMLLCLNKELLKTFLSSQICPYLGGKEIPQIGVYFSLLILSFPYFRFSRAREKTTSPQYTQKRKKKKKSIVFSIPLLSTQIPSLRCTLRDGFLLWFPAYIYICAFGSAYLFKGETKSGFKQISWFICLKSLFISPFSKQVKPNALPFLLYLRWV